MSRTSPNLEPDAGLDTALYVYVDETSYVDANGTEMIGSGILVTPTAVAPAVIERALQMLREDPDRSKPEHKQRDDETLARGFFHASEDGQNAHSWLARAIVAHVTGRFLFATAARTLQGSERDYRRQVMQNLVRALKTTHAIHLTFEERSGFSHIAAETIVRTLHEALDWSTYDLPLIPSFYPEVIVTVTSKKEPGLQVTDLLLWATVQRKASPHKSKARMFGYCGLRLMYAAGPVDGIQSWDTYEVNGGDPALDAGDLAAITPYPVAFNDIENPTVDELNGVYCFAEQHVHAYAARELPRHAKHLAKLLSQTSRMLRHAQTGTRHIELVARSFIRIFDTVPLHDADVPRRDFRMLVMARRYLGLVLRPDLLHGVRTLDYFTQLRRTNVTRAPAAFGLPENFFRRPTHDEIAVAAYYVWQSRGSGEGNDVHDWLQAEKQLRAGRSRLAK